jgi:Peptidase family M48
VVTLTESLVRGLTPREVDAVIAHELGHHKSGHLKFNLSGILFWVYFLAAGPLLGWLQSRYGLPNWALTVPIVPLLFVAMQGMFSQRREFAADARAVEIPGDAEGTIAALARLAQLSRVPVQSGGMMGSIMSHPSMEKRVLALARRHNIPDSRALLILQDPNSAYQDLAGWKPSQPAAVSLESKPVFSLRAKAVLLEQLRWMHLLVPLAGALLLALVVNPVLEFPSRGRILAMLAAGPALVLALMIVIDTLWQLRFASRLRRALARRLNPSSGAAFVGIHPGTEVRYTEGFADWDFGFFTMEDGWLCYRGEKTRFAIPKQDLLDIRVVEGRPSWMRERRVEVVHPGGAFTLNAHFARPTKANARRTAKWLQEWASSPGVASARPLPPPLLPALPGLETSRWSAFWYASKIVLKLWLAAPLMVMFGWRSGFAVAMVVLVAPVAAFLRMLPAVLWPIRKPRPSPEPMVREPVYLGGATVRTDAPAP